MNRDELGRAGEEAAVQHLTKNGFSIIKRNYRFGHYEVDIIAKKNEELRFIEVKTRSSSYWGLPKEFVGRKQELRYIEAAEHYLESSDFDGDVYFDIIEVYAHQKWRVNHIEEAFYG